ncbi:V-type ATP synthase subunit D [Arthrobacter sp. CG_A4]|uniref:V-type ATP synthase subunit D n=1 Tax=Arthrobacter sp. CG_A4 TaxID=3071706 RepID=UPI002E02BC10|nr:V/A-type H+-transporting ATPase subunit D [Arthrobacter sp. CG_A4]
MDQVSATRSELLARRGQIRLAVQGRDLLSEKRAALMKEFQRLGTSVLEAMRELERGAAAARRALGEALALDGPEFVGSAAVAASSSIGVELTTRSVAGVRIAELSHEPVARSSMARGYGLPFSSARVDVAGDAFERQMERLLDLAAVELTLRRLAEEIASTTRRVSALEHVVIPRLEGERDFIALVLDERELEDRVRLMRAKSMRMDARDEVVVLA